MGYLEKPLEGKSEVPPLGVEDCEGGRALRNEAGRVGVAAHPGVQTEVVWYPPAERKTASSPYHWVTSKPRMSL